VIVLCVGCFWLFGRFLLGVDGFVCVVVGWGGGGFVSVVGLGVWFLCDLSLDGVFVFVCLWFALWFWGVWVVGGGCAGCVVVFGVLAVCVLSGYWVVVAMCRVAVLSWLTFVFCVCWLVVWRWRRVIRVVWV